MIPLLPGAEPRTRCRAAILILRASGHWSRHLAQQMSQCRLGEHRHLIMHPGSRSVRARSHVSPPLWLVADVEGQTALSIAVLTSAMQRMQIVAEQFHGLTEFRARRSACHGQNRLDFKHSLASAFCARSAGALLTLVFPDLSIGPDIPDPVLRAPLRATVVAIVDQCPAIHLPRLPPRIHPFGCCVSTRCASEPDLDVPQPMNSSRKASILHR